MLKTIFSKECVPFHIQDERRMMIYNSIARKVLYPAAATALVVGGTVAAGPANALLSDNVHDVGAGGMTNCNGGDVCVKKVGDELEVSYEVQFGNMPKSSDHGTTVKGNMIAFPSVMKDAKLEVVATSKNGTGRYSPATETDGYPTHKFDKPVEVPVYTPEELEKKNIPYDGGEISFILPEGADEDKDSSYVKKYSSDNKDREYEDRFFATHLKGENIINDFKKNGGNGDVVKGIGSDGVSKDSIFYDKSLEKAGAMPTDSPYDYFVFNNDAVGVQTFKVTGKVKTESDLAYLPIRAKEGFYKCGQEGKGFGITDKDPWREIPNPDDRDSYEPLERNDCRNLLEDYEWARSDDTLPHYSLENNEVTKSNIKNDTEHGLMGSKKCAVTEDDGRYDRIEQDVEPRLIGATSNGSNKESTSWGANYTAESVLHANRAVTYILSGYLAAEDNCDQAGVKISLCNEDKPDETPSTTPEETPSTTPNESTSKTTTPEHPSKSSTPKTETVTTDTPSSEKTTPVETPDNPAEDTEDVKENVKTTPTVPGATPGKTTNFGHSTSQPDQGAVAVESPEKATVGPEVNTGGEVESTSLFAKVINIFK